MAVAAAAVVCLAHPGRTAAMLALTAVAAAAAARGASARDDALAPPAAVWFAVTGSPDAVMADGHLVSDAQVGEDETMRARVALDALEIDGRWMKMTGVVQWYVGGRAARYAPEWTAGRRVRAPVSWRWPRVTHNFGSPDPQWQALLRGYALSGSVKSAALASVQRAVWWQEWAAAARRRVRRVITDTMGRADPLAAAVTTAILIGDRSRLDPEVIARLRDAGTYHVVAISGGNVALVVAAIMLALRGIVRSFRWGVALAIPGVSMYALVVGGDPSVDRAIAAAVLYLSAEWSGMIVQPLDILAVVMAGLVMYEPVMAVTPAAWLSFGATAGIMIAADRLLRVMAAGRGQAMPARDWMRRWGLGILSATMAAELALVPITTAVFSRVSVAGLALNLVAIPAMSVVELAGIALVFVHAVPIAGSLAMWAAVWGVRALVGSALVVSWLPWLTWRAPPSSTLWIIAFYGSAMAALSWRGRWRRWAWWGAGVSLAVIVTAPGVWLARPTRGWLRLTMIDVGQGDALLVQFASGRSLLIDAGPSSDAFDGGERVVTPALWALGVRRLDWLAFTHADLDHIGGTMAVAETFSPIEVWEGVPVERDEPRARLKAAALQRGQVWRQLRAGDTFDTGGVSVDVLSPPVPDWERQRVRNDDSLVMRIRDGDVEILLTGDIGQDVEAALPVGGGSRRALRILKVAHHGSRSSSSSRFVEGYAPDIALISVGRHNTFGHPAPEVLQRLAGIGAFVERTDEDGAISVETDGREVRLKTWSGRQLTMKLGAPGV